MNLFVKPQTVGGSVPLSGLEASAGFFWQGGKGGKRGLSLFVSAHRNIVMTFNIFTFPPDILWRMSGEGLFIIIKPIKQKAHLKWS